MDKDLFIFICKLFSSAIASYFFVILVYYHFMEKINKDGEYDSLIMMLTVPVGIFSFIGLYWLSFFLFGQTSY
jgi:hypothetical protein